MINSDKMRKDPFSLGLEGEFLQIVPETLEHPLYTFLVTKFPSYLKNWQQNLRKLYF